jgi:membrane-bound lytic murein transglycosylase A
MIAQDTGSAIVGPARADIYYGAGDDAGKVAGRLRNPGMFALLMPRALDPAVAGAAMPVPTPRPVVTAKVPAKPSKDATQTPATKSPPARPVRRGRVRWHA